MLKGIYNDQVQAISKRIGTEQMLQSTLKRTCLFPKAWMAYTTLNFELKN